MSDDPYTYPGTTVLKNKLDIRDRSRLDQVEREFVIVRSASCNVTGQFDLAHLQAIHRHLYQDLYDWAGEIRTVEISKDGHQFQFRQYIGTGMADVHRRLTAGHFLRDLSPGEFARQAAEALGDINYVHPFRDGNGRAQLLYLKQLAAQAGHALDLSRLEPASWIQASKEAFDTRYDLMARCIEGCIGGPLSRPRNRSGTTEIRPAASPGSSPSRG